MVIFVEGGFPVKRFIVGDDDVSPNISAIFNNSCVVEEFDFLDIVVK